MAEDLSPKEIEEIYQNALAIRDTDDIELIKSVSCAFFREGGCPKVYTSECKGCLDEDSVLACRDIYLAGIFDTPSRKWSEAFDSAVKADKKVKVEELEASVGQRCDSCYMSDRCPLYKAKSECRIDWGDDVKVEDLKNEQIVNQLIKIQMGRVKRMGTFEKIDGGMVDMNLSTEMDRLSRLVSERYNLSSTHFKATIEGRSPAQQESGGGLLAKLFGGGGEKELREGDNKKALPEKSQSVSDVPSFEDIEYEELKEEKPNAQESKRKSRRRRDA